MTVNISQQTKRLSLSTFAALMLTLPAASGPAMAEPDPGPSVVVANPMNTSTQCPLSRIDTQFVRCDNLTGAGVKAPQWVLRR